MQFIDLGAQRARIGERLNAAMQRVVEEGRYILGPQVAEFEQKLAEYAGVKHVVACASGSPDGSPLTDDDAVRLACAVADSRVRDALYALAVGENAASAEVMWATLTRMLPAPWRIEALVLLAFSAYARGDGPLAGVALQAALDVDSEHRMAGMLDAALQSGMRPDRIRELALTGYKLAERLGVQMPPRKIFGRSA